MDPDAVIFDLSSDEDVGWPQNLGDGDGCDRVEDCKWIQDFFNDDDSDDVVLVREVVVKPKDNKLKIIDNSYVKHFNDDDDDDDDCVILAGDPDKAVEGQKIQNDAVQSDSDELVVVGETGQVACRDYPHPRDLCAKFSFTSTPHEQYCNQCHCYVCDSLAPCLQWGTGISFGDHCHATGKEEFWKEQRDNLKKRRQTDLLVPKVLSTSISTNPIETNRSRASTPRIQYHIPQARVPMSAPISSTQYRTSQTQVPRPAPISQLQYRTSQAQTKRLASIQPCTTGTVKTPSIIGQRSGSPMPKNNSPPALTSLLHSVRNNVLARDRRHTVGSLGPRVNVPTAVFKRRGSSGVALASSQKDGYLNTAQGYKYMRNPAVVAAPGNSTTMMSAEITTESDNRQPSSQQYMRTIPSCFTASQPRLQHHLSSQPTVAIPSICHQAHTQPLLSSQLNASNVLVNSTCQLQIPSQQAHVGAMVLRPNSSQPRVSLQPIKSNSFGNRVSSEPPVYIEPNPASEGHQNYLQQQNQTSNFEDTSFLNFDMSWVTKDPIKTHDISQQPQAQNFQLQGSAFLDESSSFDEFDCYFDRSSDEASFNFQFDN